MTGRVVQGRVEEGRVVGDPQVPAVQDCRHFLTLTNMSSLTRDNIYSRAANLLIEFGLGPVTGLGSAATVRTASDAVGASALLSLPHLFVKGNHLLGVQQQMVVHMSIGARVAIASEPHPACQQGDLFGIETLAHHHRLTMLFRQLLGCLDHSEKTLQMQLQQQQQPQRGVENDHVAREIQQGLRVARKFDA